MPADPFLRSVEDTFRRHGIAAVLDPDGVARDVRLLPTRADSFADFGEMRVQASNVGMFEILASAFEGFGKEQPELQHRERDAHAEHRRRLARPLQLLLRSVGR